MDAMILDKPDLDKLDATFEMPRWWNRPNRARIGCTGTDTDTDTQALETDLGFLFWEIPDPFCTLSPDVDPPADQEYWNFGPVPSPFVAESSQLNNRVSLLASELNKLHHDPMSAAIFTESNFLAFLSSLYRYRHSQIPTVHWPTFNPETVSLPLLLATAMAGALFAHTLDDVASRSLRPSQDLCDAAETFIFAQLETFDSVTERLRDDEILGVGAVEVCQAALLIELIQSQSYEVYGSSEADTSLNRPNRIGSILCRSSLSSG
ncbi:hypothetical protein QQZ08_005161 [Neonectria magnoliae]|uniref:Transcription factor domain-containing protein n=1 Tax=Neonectria magnoliae TaxID=2732573 RepID=A0ABR1I4W2_9HYPO